PRRCSNRAPCAPPFIEERRCYTLTDIDESAARPPAPLLCVRRRTARPGCGRGPRGLLQGPRRSDARGDREPPRRGWGGLRLRPHTGLRSRAADRVAPPEALARGRSRRIVAARHVGVLPPLAGADRAAQAGPRRL